MRLTRHFVAGQEPHTSKADGGDISWDIDISAAEGTTQADEGQADIDWDAAPAADEDIPAQNIDWDIGVDDNATQEAPELAQTGKSTVLSLVTEDHQRDCAHLLCLVISLFSTSVVPWAHILLTRASGRSSEIWRAATASSCRQMRREVCHAGGIVGEMVSDGDFRSSLVNEVHELMAYLQTRLSEAGSMQILGGSHALLEPVSSATLKHWLQV